MNKINIYILISAIVIIIFVVIMSVPQLRQFLTTQVARDISLQKTIRITIPEDAPPGEHTFQINVQESNNGDLLATSEILTIVVEDTSSGNSESNDGDGNDGSDESGSGGGESGGSGGGGGHEPSIPHKSFAFAPERGHKISGTNAGIIKDSGRVVARLTSSSDILSKNLKVPTNNYWLYLTAKHNTPQPVKVAIYINNKAWKIITLNKGDNQYRTHRAGLLRTFKTANVRFRLINNQSNSPLLIDAWALSTNPNLKTIKAPSNTGVIKGTKTKGTHLLPRLNQITREELGKQFVLWDIWSYYAPRLAAPSSKRYAIGTEERLREVMRFWKLVRPQRPRGG